jgi:hypothetical protein
MHQHFPFRTLQTPPIVGALPALLAVPADVARLTDQGAFKPLRGSVSNAVETQFKTGPKNLDTGLESLPATRARRHYFFGAPLSGSV